MLIWMAALAVSIDGFAAGVAFGLRSVRIGAGAKTAIALLSAGFAALAITAGTAIARVIPAGAGGKLGAAVLIALGLMASLRALLPRNPEKKGPEVHTFNALGLTIMVMRNPEKGDLDHSGVIDLKEALLLGFSLSIDMLGAGIGLAMTGAGGFWMLPPAVGLVQIGCLALGEAVGHQLTRLPVSSKTLSCFSGLLLISLGVARLFV